MMGNKVVEAREWLSRHVSPDEFGAQIELAVERGGVVYMAPDCFLTGAPAADDPRTLVVFFQCSDIRRLCRVLRATGYERVRYQRTKNTEWVTREVADFEKKLALADMIYEHRREDAGL